MKSQAAFKTLANSKWILASGFSYLGTYLKRNHWSQALLKEAPEIT